MEPQELREQTLKNLIAKIEAKNMELQRMKLFRWRRVDDGLPKVGEYVCLLADRYWNTPDGIPEMKVVCVGYLNDFGGIYWSVFGERGFDLDAFTHWMPLPAPPGDE